MKASRVARRAYLLFTFCSLLFINPAFAGKESTVNDPDSKEVIRLQEKVQELDNRLGELESRAVLSDPELIVKQKDVWVCAKGHRYDNSLDGVCPLDKLPLRKKFTYEREKVYRRQTIGEQIERVLAAEAGRGITIGISATSTLQEAYQLRGNNQADGEMFGIGSLDIFFIAKPALYTMFFADIETIGGISPDERIDNISLLTSDVDRLDEDKEVNAREAWLRSELFSQKLVLSIGVLDLTNYFDLNMAANDETTQFITDALVNNLLLSPPTNGAGVVAVFDPKTGLVFRAGVQRGSNVRKSLTERTYSIFEMEYLSHLGSLPEGHYRFWYRLYENTAWGISADQKLTPYATAFFRYGQGLGSEQFSRGDSFYSGGVEIRTPHTFGLRDKYAVAFHKTSLATGINESLAEVYYSLFLTDNVRTSFHMQYLIDSNKGGNDKSYLIPAVRVQLDF
ncbi:MAG: hypothetical protein IEMM0002_1413 [bacterium]|nr:MAG: hypothetical protein IEMM0002_1413 [bacterium]